VGTKRWKEGEGKEGEREREREGGQGKRCYRRWRRHWIGHREAESAREKREG
jgi:hypothetical protein